MRKAMAEAKVGDDVYDEDPTVNRLQELACEVTGKEAAIYTATGTMANSLAIRTRCRPGDEVLMHELAHPFHYEGGGVAAFSGTTIRPLPGERGIIDPDAFMAELKPLDRHFSRQRLLCIENTHNRGGGTVVPLDHVRELSRMARDAGLETHMDGARIFNASLASGVPVRDYAAQVDTISFCLSKGLGAPVGSLLCGTSATIDQARRFRQILGGGWRQAGIIAAAGIYALENHVERIEDDHCRARRLGEAVEGSSAVRLLSPVETNIVVFGSKRPGVDAAGLQSSLEALGVRVSLVTYGVLRAVLHLDVDDDDLYHAINAIEELEKN